VLVSGFDGGDPAVAVFGGMGVVGGEDVGFD
jgi:hypothetical protein